MGYIRIIYKTFFLLFFMGLFFATSIVGKIIPAPSPSSKTKLRRQQSIVGFFAAIALKIWRVKVITKPAQWNIDKGLIIGNHLGFIDIFALLTLHPFLFVTSMEMKQNPFFGLFTDMAGCLYVERRSRDNIQNEKSTITEHLKEGFNVVLYPEGTSGDGQEVLPFKRTLMMAAAEAEVPVYPICFNFLKINGEPFSHKWRDYVCWYGDLSFANSMAMMFQLRSIEIEVKFLEPFTIQSSDDKAAVALKAHDIIAQHYIKVPRP